MRKFYSDTPENQGGLISSLTEKTELFVFVYSPKHKSLVSWSNNSRQVLGVKDADIVKDGNLFLRHVHPDDRFLLLTDLEHALKGKNDYRATYRWIRPDNNETRWLHCRAILNVDEGVFEGMMIDLSEELTGSVGTIAGPDSLGTVLSAFPTLVFTVDSDLRLLRINRSKDRAVFRFGDEQFKEDNFRIGRPILSLFGSTELKDIYGNVIVDILSGKKPHYRTRIDQDGLVYSLEISPLMENNSINGLLFIASEITELVRLERQISHLQKIEGLGLLAAGVAHNFNNSLQGILGQAAIIQTHPENITLVREAGKMIAEIVSRSSELTRQLLNFDYKSTGTKEPIDVNLVAMAALNKLEHVFAKGIKVSVAFGNPDLIKGQQTQLIECVTSVITTAVDAMPNGGTLTIRTSQVNLEDFEIQDLRGGSYAKIRVSDTGQGMSEEEQKRCLEPFYSTRENDSFGGIGVTSSNLGLSTAFALARKYDGTMIIDSGPGIGTTVDIYFPISSAVKEANGFMDQVRVSPTRPPKILIVDDDSLVLETVHNILSDLGYESMAAESAERALSMIRAHGSSLEVVLLDVIMPGMDGITLLKEIKRINKNLKVIGFTGAPPAQVQAMVDLGVVEVLQKPVGPIELQRALNSALAARAA